MSAELEAYYCPGCAEPITETLWVWQGRWYCTEKCARTAAKGY